MKTDPPDFDAIADDDPRYRRAARLLAQKLGVAWRDLPREQVLEYLRKIKIAGKHTPRKSDG